ncbi:hypothetical protein QUF95_12410 [Paenibacillus silvae]|uniref:hypothetical protein n=1 Tax=Paenibacillus silvae TaxID=1325358 RepID=UPI0025A2F717|nr:hypothetical protein [Paenibacillus silvae]MDM5278194.1 hypothetical protein [Paenibacillus silvae]
MTSNIWIPIDHIQDQEPIWAGTRIRMFEFSPNGVEQNEQKQNKAERSEQYMEYLLSYIHGNSDELQLTCLTQGEAGNIGAVVSKDLPNHYTLAQTLKAMLAGTYSEVLFE